MPHQIVILADPGIDGAFAAALALHDPSLEVLGLAATAGNVDAEQATKNVHIIVEQIDPRRWPRVWSGRSCRVRDRCHGPAWQRRIGRCRFPGGQAASSAPQR